MPRQGNTVESCVIVGWKVAEGQAVAASQPICEVETDKASFEVPAGADGVVLKILHPEGDDVPVLQPIAVIGKSGEDWASLVGKDGAPAAGAPSEAQARLEMSAPAAEGSAPASAGTNPPAAQAEAGAAAVGFASPRARNLAAGEGLPLAGIPGSGPGGRIIERDIKAALGKRPELTAAARVLATKGAAVPGAGTAFGGRAGVADFAAAAAAAAPAAVSAVTAATTAPFAVAGVTGGAGDADFPGPYAETPIKSIRKIIADRMMHSLQASAQLTFNASAPAERLLSMRNRLKNSDPALGLSGVTIGDLVAFAATRVLAKYPRINAHVVDGAVRSFGRVHLGLAVDTPRGLMVPVIRGAESLSLRAFSERSKKLAGDCVAGSPNPDLLSGSTFTVTNLGAFGIESFTPILNEPETGILGVDAIVPRPTISKDGTVGAEMRIGFSLTVDHRVVDGADAARFLKDLGDYIANIDIVMLV